MKYFAHDFLIEETSTNKIKNCFFFHITIYCTHDRNWIDEDTEKFFLSVGNPSGIAHHFEVLQEVFRKDGQKSFFNTPLLIVDEFSEDNILPLLTAKIQSISGGNKRELLFNLSPFFEWEYLGNSDIVRDVFSKK